MLRRQGRELGHGSGRGEVHQLQPPPGVQLPQGQKGLQRQRLAQDRIGGPASPQGLHPLAYEALLTQRRIAGRQQQGCISHLAQGQGPLQQRQRRRGCPLRQTDRPGRQLIRMGSQLQPLAAATEASPEQELKTAAALLQLQGLRGIAPAACLGQQRHRSVASGHSGALEGGLGFGHAVAGVLQQ